MKMPKHRSKMAKNLTKMHGLAVCQMNMMQILLQKISRRSKVIQKQEKIVNENLKRKRIYLEKEKFDLMSVLRRSLEASENGVPQQALASNAASKSKPRTASDLNSNSRCPSTQGTKSGVEMPSQSNLGSTTAPIYGEDLSSVEGFNNSRKPTSGGVSIRSNFPRLQSSSHQVLFPDVFEPEGGHLPRNPRAHPGCCRQEVSLDAGASRREARARA